MERNDRLWDAPEPTDATRPDWSAAPAAPAPTRLRGSRRGIATALLAGGLLVIGGVAAVSAADPSASPDATSQPADPGSSAQPDGDSDHQRGDCPEDGSGGSGGSGDDEGTDSSPDASPNASDSDV